MGEFHFDATFVAFLAFVIFFGILYWLGVHKTVFASLDGQTAKIADELAAARKLREEAEALKAEYEKKKAQAESEAADIVAAAKDQAKRVAEDARTQMSADIARRQKQAEDSIARAEAQASAEVRAAAADAAIAAAEKMLRGDLSADAHARLIEQGAKDLAAKFA
jgi:F-type H+-transporting ATPase subunit b